MVDWVKGVWFTGGAKAKNLPPEEDSIREAVVVIVWKLDHTKVSPSMGGD